MVLWLTRVVANQSSVGDLYLMSPEVSRDLGRLEVGEAQRGGGEEGGKQIFKKS